MNDKQAKTGLIDPTRRRKSSGRFDSIDFLTFLIPCLQFVQVRAVGILSGSDLLFLASFLYLFFRGKIRVTTKDGRRLLLLCTLWLASQCVTDIVRHSAFADYARGWSNIGLTLVNFCVIYALSYGRPRRLVIYGWGLVIGGVLAFLIIPDEFALDYPWKFGIGQPVTMAMLLFASRKECRDPLPIYLAAMMGIVNIALGARSLGGICLAVALYLFTARSMRRKANGHLKLNAGVVLTRAALLVLGAVGILWAYQYAASTGVLGQDARAKYMLQSSGKYGILLGGRTEMLAYLPAIYDSPILGHGSWAKDPIYLIEMRQSLAVMGYTMPDDLSVGELDEGLIPTHSFIFGAWVDAGVLGAVFWVWIWFLAARGLLRVYPTIVALLPIASYFAFLMLWDLLFSPYGATERIMVPYYIVTLMSCMSMAAPKVIQAAGRSPDKAADASVRVRINLGHV